MPRTRAAGTSSAGSSTTTATPASAGGSRASSRAEHGARVTLWIDDLARARAHRARRRRRRACAAAGGRRDRAPLAATRCADAGDRADVVVEAFGCGLPDALRRRDGARGRAAAPGSSSNTCRAEPWVDGAHGLAVAASAAAAAAPLLVPGLHARRTGGLLRERGPPRGARRVPRATPRRAGGAVVVAAACRRAPPDEIRVSLFCYPNRAAAGAARRLGRRRRAGRLPRAGRRRGRRARRLDRRQRAAPGGVRSRAARLTLHAIPFVAQDDYDRLLWACDLNFVRGEDSFVRAQWAARPFVWQIYPQADGAHLAKLDAFLDRYCAGLAAGAAAALAAVLARLERRRPGAGPVGAAWPALRRAPARSWRRMRPRLGRRSSPRCPNSPTGLVKAGRVAGIIEGFPNQPLIAVAYARCRNENRPGSPRRQRDHGRQRPDGRAEGRVHASPAATRRSSR